MPVVRTPDLVLVDGSSYLYRAFHALPPLATSRGEPTGAIHGVLNMLAKLVREYPQAELGVVFDAPGRTFRDELFAEYKAHRPPMPEDLRAQVEPLLALVRAQGLPLLRIAGVEADDVIGTLARRAAAAGREVLISTGDKDMAQLVGERITLVNTMSGSVLDRDGVKAKFGVWPEQIVDFLALTGDASDNIPGIDLVGPKTAARWLMQFATLDALLAHAGELAGRAAENLRAGGSTLALSHELATIRTDLELPPEAQQLLRSAPDARALRELYGRYELRSLLRQLEGSASADATVAGGAEPTEAPAGLRTPDRQHYATITAWAVFEEWLERLHAAELFAFDTETTSLDYMQARIVGVSFCIEPGRGAYVPLAHDYAGAPAQLPAGRVLAALKPLLEDPARGKLGQHLKYDMHVLENHGIRLAGARFDTMLESYVLNSTATRHDMDSMAARYLGLETLHYEDVAGKGAKQIPFSQVSIERATEYSAEDADVTLQLHGTLWPQLAAAPALARLYTDVEQPLVPVLQRMERHGVLINREMLRAQSGEIGRRLLEVQAQAHAEAGTEFNIESPRQLQQILFDRLQLPVLRKTPTGQPSTAEDVLEELAGDYALPRQVLEYRGLAKLRSTYTEKLPEQINAATGRVHTSYHQAVAATGRLSSTDPNLQNIPIRTPEGRRIRQAFIAPPGWKLLAADYSQIELRIMAHLSGDAGLLGAFSGDADIHQATAAEVFSVAPEAVSAEQRRSAKAINFGLIYGMSAFGLARQLGIDRGAAQRYVDTYFARYPGVKAYMDATRARARQAGYVETVFGRRLYLPDIKSRNRALQQYAERSAINAPMQGTAADIIKRAMLAVDSWCQVEQPPVRLIMQVHDELVLEVRADYIEAASARLRAAMSSAAALAVPLRVDVGVGDNWDQAH
ncbi:MAG: DNA polymerase I [Gammaproteobacteria bacterium]|nr:DNA polymerase I [Gammaproteobacteria bacterium]